MRKGRRGRKGWRAKGTETEGEGEKEETMTICIRSQGAPLKSSSKKSLKPLVWEVHRSRRRRRRKKKNQRSVWGLWM
jgi:hypothetical protein